MPKLETYENCTYIVQVKKPKEGYVPSQKSQLNSKAEIAIVKAANLSLLGFETK